MKSRYQPAPPSLVLKVWNYLSGKLLTSYRSPSPFCQSPISISSKKDQHHGVDTPAEKLPIYHLSNGEEVLPAWQAHTQRVAGLLFNPGRAELISLGAEGNLIRWELKSILLTRTSLAGLQLSTLPELDQLLSLAGWPVKRIAARNYQNWNSLQSPARHYHIRKPCHIDRRI